MSGLRDELKEMSRGFRWGRRPLVPRSAEPFAEEKDDVGFPTDWARTQAGTAARQAILKGFMHPLLKNELSLRVFGLDNLKGVDAPGRVLLEPLEPPRRDAHPDHAPRRVAGEDRGGRGARLLLRRVVASGVHRARVRRVPDRPVARRSRRGGQGARADRGRLEPGRVPRGHALAGRTRAAVPSRRVPPLSGARCRRRADRDPRRVSGDAEGPVLAEGRAARPSRFGTARRCTRSRARRTRTCRAGWRRRWRSSSTRTARTWWDSLQRAERNETPSLAGPQGPDWLKRWEGSKPLSGRGETRTWE